CMMLLPTEWRTRLARGSMRQPPPTTHLYSCPSVAPGASTDQLPFPSGASGVLVSLQPLNCPATETAEANGAHTRKVHPPGYGMAPIPGRGEGVGMSPPTLPEATCCPPALSVLRRGAVVQEGGDMSASTGSRGNTTRFPATASAEGGAQRVAAYSAGATASAQGAALSSRHQLNGAPSPAPNWRSICGAQH